MVGSREGQGWKKCVRISEQVVPRDMLLDLEVGHRSGGIVAAGEFHRCSDKVPALVVVVAAEAVPLQLGLLPPVFVAALPLYV